MKTLRDSFALKEAARISGELVAEAAINAPANQDTDWPRVTLAQPVSVVMATDTLDNRSEPAELSSDDSEPAIVYREELLENTLVTMCKRGGFNGAVIADDNGFPLAAYNSPVDDEILAAFTSVLGMALGEAGKLLEEHEANHISLDINYTEKAALRLFHVDDNPYFMMIICPQEIDEKAEVELSIGQVAKILK